MYAKVKAIRDMLLRDFDHLLERAQILSKSCDRGMDVAGNNARVAESRSAIQQAEWVAKLTMLAFFFIPASFSTSLFGISFVQFWTRLFKHLAVDRCISTYLYDFHCLYYILTLVDFEALMDFWHE